MAALILMNNSVAYGDPVEQLYQGGVTIVNKEHFTTLYRPGKREGDD